MNIQITHSFRRQSVWALIGLTVITLGFYALLWLFRQTLVSNRLLPEDRISNGFVISFVSISVLITLTIITVLIFADDRASARELSKFLSDINFILILVWTFRIRNRINKLLDVSDFNPYRLNVIWTVLFGIFYLQYKINSLQTIEEP